MEFCPKCDNLLEVVHNGKNKPVLQCGDCEKVVQLKQGMEKNYVLTESIEHDELDKTEVVEARENSGISEEIREDLMESYRESIESFQY